MSKMGNAILNVQEMVDSGVKSSDSFDKIMSDVRHYFGDMFEGIAEEYYEDYYGDGEYMNYDEVYDVEAYEELCSDLEEEGIL